MNEARFWRDFLDWHLRTDHPWDTRLAVEAMTGSIREFTEQIGTVLLPVVQKAADAMRAFSVAYAALPSDTESQP